MGDLTDEEIGARRLEYLETCLAKRWQVPIEDIALMIKEIRRRRAAQTASAERVRAVVRESADMVIQTRGYRGALGAQYDPILDAIAVRVAAQLTSPAAGAPRRSRGSPSSRLR